jgi:O-antigen/teichoic acid export membrane protein
MSPTRRHASRAGLSWVGVATVFSAGCTWLMQAVAGHTLSLADFVEFMAVWGVFFALLGVLQGVQQEVTRSVSAVQARRVEGVRPLLGTLLLGSVGGLLLVLSGPWWLGHLHGMKGAGAAAPLAVAVLVYAIFNLLAGGLAGRSRWGCYAVLIATEGLTRCLFVVAVLLGRHGVAWFAWALAGGGLSAVVLMVGRRFRAALTCRGDGTSLEFLSRALLAMLAAGASALSIAGFPFLLSATAHEPLPPSAAVVIAAVLVTRAPLLITLNALQAAAISRFVHQGAAVLHHLMVMMGVLAVLTAVGCAASFYLGPPVLVLVYGAAFVAHGGLFVGVVAGAGLMAMLMLSGSASLARGLHRGYAAGWLLASMTTAACLALHLSVEGRTVIALIAGPLSGLGLHLGMLVRQSRSGAPSEADPLALGAASLSLVGTGLEPPSTTPNGPERATEG